MTTAFRYRAATAAGQLVEGRLEAGTAAEAIDALRRQSLVPVVVEPAVSIPASRRGRPASSLAASLRGVATLVSAGLPLERALTFAADHAGDQAVQAGWRGVLEAVRSGDSLSVAMGGQPMFVPFAIAVVRAGEESGTLGEALDTVAAHQERSAALSASIRSALLYPALMGIAAGVGVVLLLTVAIPRFIAMLGVTGGELPLTTRVLVGASSIISRGMWIWLPLAALGVLAARAWLADEAHRRRWHAARLRSPVTGPLESAVAAARFCRALGVLLRAGVPMLASLRLARGVVGNQAVGAVLDDAVRAVARGDGVSASLAPALPPLARQLLAAGEEGGQLAVMCGRAADQLEQEAQRRLQGLVRLIEPALIIAFGGLVGFVALAMLQAMYAINAGLPVGP
jgi:type II secretory pathway component PulF